MSLNIRKWKSNVLAQVIGTILQANFTFAAANSETLQIAAGNKAKVNTQNKRIDYQKLSEERAAAVAHYFYEVQNIRMRRILGARWLQHYPSACHRY